MGDDGGGTRAARTEATGRSTVRAGTGDDAGDDAVMPAGATAPSGVTRRRLLRWTTIAPLLALALLGAALGLGLHDPVTYGAAALLLAAAVLASVHHAEVVAHRVGEPFGSLILAVAVTIIEVGLILTIMSGGGEGTETLARDTVFAAAMITMNGIVGLSLFVATLRRPIIRFNADGASAALATALTLAVVTMVLPALTTSAPGPQFTAPQLAFAAVASIVIYALFVATQTVRHRSFFLPVDDRGRPLDTDADEAEPPSNTATLLSLGLLVAALVAVVGLAKVAGPAIEGAVAAAGLPASFVGVVIALLVLAPETLAAAKAARRDRVQISLNLGYGSAIASIGLTVPVIALSTIWIPGPLMLGLEPIEMALLAVTAVVSVLTVVRGRATRQQAGLHLVLAAAFVFLMANP